MILLDAYEIVEATRGATSADTVGVIESLIELYEFWGKPDQAANWEAKLGRG